MSSFLSVRYLNNMQTGEITADQEAYIDTLLAKYNMTDCNPNRVPLKTSVFSCGSLCCLAVVN
jgi:hypothetical protein